MWSVETGEADARDTTDVADLVKFETFRLILYGINASQCIPKLTIPQDPTRKRFHDSL